MCCRCNLWAEEGILMMFGIKKQKKEQSEVFVAENVMQQLKTPLWAWGVLLVIIAVAMWFRLWHLGDAALRADTITFWTIFQRELSWGDYFTKWLEIMGISGQFPFSMVFSKAFLDVFQLDLTHFTIRLPSALWGVLAVFCAFGAGRSFVGYKFGLVLAGMLAMNPYHLQVTREVYYYPPLVVGAFLFLWVAFDITAYVGGKREKLPVMFYVRNALAFFLLTYTQPTGWPSAFLLVLLVSIAALVDIFRRKKWLNATLIYVTYAVLGLPLLFSGWALPHLLKNASGSTKEAALAALAVSSENVWTMIYKFLTSFAWGGNTGRALFTFLILIIALITVAMNFKRNRRILIPLYLILGGFTLYLVSRASTGAMFGTRYVLGLLPAYLMLLVIGLFHAVDLCVFLKKKPAKAQHFVTGVLIAISFLLLIRPAVLCTQLSGKPTPYKDIVSWANSNLPSGTPVLVDRWLEPWNELAVYPSTNVFFTFTIPNEPLTTYLNNNWRQSAKEFFKRFPDAAYLEIIKSYQDVESVGPWKWPAEHFAQHVTIANDAGLKLRELGVASRGDFYAANSNRVVVEYFYNTTEDLLKKAREEQKPYLLLYGPGWSFMKPWRQTRQYTEYRMLEQHAPLDVYNMLDRSYQVNIVIQAVALNGTKRVQTLDGKAYDFPPQKVVVKELGPFTLQPGKNQIMLTDGLWPAARNPLLVASAAVKPIQ